jgi:hypothetical protein
MESGCCFALCAAVTCIENLAFGRPASQRLGLRIYFAGEKSVFLKKEVYHV